MYLPFRQMQSTEYPVAGTDPLPLFPVNCSDPVAEPLVQFRQETLHVCKPVVINPAADIVLQLFLTHLVTPGTAPARKLPEPVLNLDFRLRVQSQPAFSLVPVESVTEVFDPADVVNCSLLEVHLQEQLFRDERYDVFFSVRSALFLDLQKMMQSSA